MGVDFFSHYSTFLANLIRSLLCGLNLWMKGITPPFEHIVAQMLSVSSLTTPEKH
jgi:hypothetical protein